MKILHLYSDWKWTGPAEPVLQMCRSLQDLGHDVTVAHCRAPRSERETVGGKVAEYELAGTERFALDRHVPPVATARDLVTLPRYVRQEAFDIVHMHLSHDHAFGGLCCRLVRRNAPVLVRSLHRRDVLRPTLAYRLLLRRLTDGWLTFTDGFRQAYIERFSLPPERVGVHPMTVDLTRFSPQTGWRDMRSEFGVPANAPVIGIVGRFQRYRKMDVFLTAARKVLDAEPDTYFFVIGRSSQMQDTVVKPCEELGIQHRVVLTGYRIDDYVDVMGTLDVFSLLMPGFDGTARAVREAMALGKPCVVTDFGMLPEIVPHERAGLVVPMQPETLADAWLRLIRNRDARARMGTQAREEAEQRFQVDAVGKCLEPFYGKLLQLHGKRTG